MTRPERPAIPIRIGKTFDEWAVGTPTGVVEVEHLTEYDAREAVRNLQELIPGIECWVVHRRVRVSPVTEWKRAKA